MKSLKTLLVALGIALSAASPNIRHAVPSQISPSVRVSSASDDIPMINLYSAMHDSAADRANSIVLDKPGVEFKGYDMDPEKFFELDDIGYGIDASIKRKLSFRLIVDPHENAQDNLDRKIRLEFDKQAFNAGITLGESDSDRLVVPYMMLNLQGHDKIKSTLFVSQSDFKKGPERYMRTNFWGAIRTDDIAFGAGTFGLDNNDKYAVSLRIREILGYGVQASALFDDQGKDRGFYKYSVLATNGPNSTSKLPSSIMPKITGANGGDEIIEETGSNYLLDPYVYRLLYEPGDNGILFVKNRDSWYLEGAYMLSEPFSNEHVKPIIEWRYKQSAEGGQQTEDIHVGARLLITPCISNGRIWIYSNYDEHMQGRNKKSTGSFGANGTVFFDW